MDAKSFAGTEVALTGLFASMSQALFIALIKQAGGRYVRELSQQTRYLIVGQAELPLERDGSPTAMLAQAQRLCDQGTNIEVIQEEEFLRRLGLTDSDDRIHHRYTILELSRLLKLPPQRIRAWVRQQLIEPVEVIHGVAVFDFHQLAAARTLCRLVESGLPASKIRKGLAQLARLIPNTDSLLSSVSVVESTSRLLVRLRNGLLSEPSGQLQLDFDKDHNSDTPHLTFTAVARTTHDLFTDAAALEVAGRFDEAARTYLQGVKHDSSDPVLRFNLGNVLFQLGHLDEAATQFRHAVQVDPLFADAWNNLAAMQYELGQSNEAIVSIQRAVRLAPSHADAGFNLQQINRLRRETTESVLGN